MVEKQFQNECFEVFLLKMAIGSKDVTVVGRELIPDSWRSYRKKTRFPILSLVLGISEKCSMSVAE